MSEWSKIGTASILKTARKVLKSIDDIMSGLEAIGGPRLSISSHGDLVQMEQFSLLRRFIHKQTEMSLEAASSDPAVMVEFMVNYELIVQVLGRQIEHVKGDVQKQLEFIMATYRKSFADALVVQEFEADKH